MGKGKARRRRRANYLDAHGGHDQLSAPPTALDVLPSKLRRIIALKSESSHGHLIEGSSKVNKASKDQGNSVVENRHGTRGMHEKQHRKQKIEKQEDAPGGLKQGDILLKAGEEGGFCPSETSRPKQKKRKWEDELQVLSEKFRATPIRKGLNDRRKRYLQEKKNKKKRQIHLNSNESLPSLHQQEKISFGETVQAPPKLSLPKKQKSAAEDRLRLRAITTYREKKKWISRPGSHQPPPLATERILSL